MQSLVQPEWPADWLGLLNAGALKREHLMLGVRWLRLNGSYAHQLWPAIWVALFERVGGSPKVFNRVLSLGWNWIEVSSLGSPGFPSIWLRFRTQKKNEKQWLRYGLEWLALEAIAHNKWPRMWLSCWERLEGDDDKRQDLRVWATNWLTRNRRKKSVAQARKDIANALE